MNALKTLIMFLVGIIAIISCQKDYYDSENIKKDFIIKDIPAGFDWSNISPISIEVIPHDLYDGKYFYTIEIFDANPLVTPKAKLYAKGVCKQNSPFKTTATFPDIISSVFIRQTSPSGEKSILMATIENKKIQCSFRPTATVSSSARINALARANSKVDVDFTLPAKYEKITGSGSFTMKKGETYLIEGEYSGSLIFPPEGKGTLYITGTWKNNAGNTTITQGSDIFVTSTGQVTTSADWNISMESQVQIAIAEGGSWGSKENNNINMTFNNPGNIINKGTFYAYNITTKTGNVDIYNNGTFTINKIHTENPITIENDHIFIAEEMNLNNPDILNDESSILQVNKFVTEGGTLLNKHKIISKEINFKRTKVTNECRITTETFTLVQGTFTFAGYSSLSCKNMDADGITLNMNSFSMLDVSNTLGFTSQMNKIEGIGNDFALLRANEIQWKQGLAPHLQFRGNLEIDCSNFLDNPDQWNYYYKLFGAAHFAQDGTTVIIPASECSGEGNNPDKDEPENPQFPIPVPLTSNLTWITEDTYPGIGDYDMNDLVVRIDSILLLQNAENKAESMELYMAIRAVGATKRIGTALQLETLSSSDILSVTRSNNTDLTGDMFETDNKGLESGQSKAVIPLFDNAHQVMGATDTRTIINTYANKAGSVKPVTSFKISLTFNTPLSQEKLQVTEFNLFAIVGNNFQPKRTEIHLPQFNHTDKSNSPQQLQESTKGLMWGLMIPGDFLYPVEAIDIRTAYPNFENWIKSNKTENMDWYLHPDPTSVYK